MKALALNTEKEVDPMGQKVIQFPGKRLKGTVNQAPVYQDNNDGQEDTAKTYINQLRVVSNRLRQIADIFELSVKEVIADFSYIAIGDEIAAAILEEESDDGIDDK